MPKKRRPAQRLTRPSIDLSTHQSSLRRPPESRIQDKANTHRTVHVELRVGPCGIGLLDKALQGEPSRLLPPKQRRWHSERAVARLA